LAFTPPPASQEDKYKAYQDQLKHDIEDYERVTSKIYPVVAELLVPAAKALELKLKPGLATLTWTSVNIDSFRQELHEGIRRLDDIINKTNDIVDNRINKNLKLISRMILVDFPNVRGARETCFGVVYTFLACDYHGPHIAWLEGRAIRNKYL
jgi:hypothetical protein